MAYGFKLTGITIPDGTTAINVVISDGTTPTEYALTGSVADGFSGTGISATCTADDDVYDVDITVTALTSEDVGDEYTINLSLPEEPTQAFKEAVEEVVSDRLLPTPISEKLLVADNNQWKLSYPNINVHVAPNDTIPEYINNETWGFTVLRYNDRTVLLLNEIRQDLDSPNLSNEWRTMTMAMVASLTADTNWHVSYSTISDSSEHYNEFYGIYDSIKNSPLYSYQEHLIQKINLNNHDFYSVYAISELQGIGLTEIYTGMRYDNPDIQLVVMARKIQSSL